MTIFEFTILPFVINVKVAKDLFLYALLTLSNQGNPLDF